MKASNRVGEKRNYFSLKQKGFYMFIKKEESIGDHEIEDKGMVAKQRGEKRVVFPMPGKYSTGVTRRREYPSQGRRKSTLPLDEQGTFPSGSEGEELGVHTMGAEDATHGSSCQMLWPFSGKLEFMVGISRNSNRWREVLKSSCKGSCGPTGSISPGTLSVRGWIKGLT